MFVPKQRGQREWCQQERRTLNPSWTAAERWGTGLALEPPPLVSSCPWASSRSAELALALALALALGQSGGSGGAKESSERGRSRRWRGAAEQRGERRAASVWAESRAAPEGLLEGGSSTPGRQHARAARTGRRRRRRAEGARAAAAAAVRGGRP